MPIFNCLLINCATEVGDNKLPSAWEREVAGTLSVGVSVLFTECQTGSCIIYTAVIFIYIAKIDDTIHNGISLLEIVYLHRSVHIGSVWKGRHWRQCTFGIDEQFSWDLRVFVLNVYASSTTLLIDKRNMATCIVQYACAAVCFHVRSHVIMEELVVW